MHIDHLVWYGADLAESRRYFATYLDAEPLYGGAHPGEGTANAVLSLGPTTYLEILGRDVNQDAACLDAEVASLDGQGLYHWAVGGVDLTALAARASAAGLTCGALVPGGRVKPDGTRLDWLCWGLSGHGFGALVPFFIDWRQSEHPARSTPRGGNLVGLEVHTPNPEGLSRIFSELGLSLPVIESAEPRVQARLGSTHGELLLSSIAPLPRGYVI